MSTLDDTQIRKKLISAFDDLSVKKTESVLSGLDNEQKKRILSVSSVNRLHNGNQLSILLNNKPEIIFLLIEHGMDPNLTLEHKDNWGVPVYSCLLKLAVVNGEHENVSKLCAAGADVNKKLPDQSSAMLWMTQINDDLEQADMIKTLVSLGAETNLNPITEGEHVIDLLLRRDSVDPDSIKLLVSLGAPDECLEKLRGYLNVLSDEKSSSYTEKRIKDIKKNLAIAEEAFLETRTKPNISKNTNRALRL